MRLRPGLLFVRSGVTPTDDNGRRVGASTAVLLGIASALVALIVGPAASAHSDPCHASHSCPSDHHSYVWTDAGGRSWDCARTGADEYEPARDTQTIVDDGLTYHCFPVASGGGGTTPRGFSGVVTSAVI